MQEKYDQARASWQRPLFKEVTILASWNIWKQRNKVVSDGETATHFDWLKEDFVILGYRINSQNLTFLEGFRNSLTT